MPYSKVLFVYPLTKGNPLFNALFCADQIVCATNAFDIFCEALKETGLDDKLNDINTHFTVFAPTDAAFHHVLYDLQYNDIYKCPKDTLRELLLLHIRENQVLAKDGLKDRCGQLMEMANNDSTRTVCENNAREIFQKGAGNSGNEMPEVISFNIEACNGILHIVNEVILPSNLSGRSSSLKSTHSPTRMPTSEPTSMFVFKPTKRPTRMPTSEPTSIFVFKPTKRPTPMPTLKPTSIFTKRPTHKPTHDLEPADSSLCSDYPRCVAQGMTGECCPTDENVKLDCCFDKSQSLRPTTRPTNREGSSFCSIFPKCVAQGLTGECCPADDNVKLDCCFEKSSYLRPTSGPTNRKPNDDSCSAYPKCAALGLTGQCCPTDENVKLDCCFDNNGSCSTHPKCSALGLTGECCPADDYAKLDCCFDTPPPSSCSTYPRCKELGLTGQCCPTHDGIKLDCCDEQVGLPILGELYCSYEPDFGCYRFGRPECCLKSSIECQKTQPECEIGWLIVGDSYCTYAPDFGCYKNGRPQCCLDDSIVCPEERPECEIGFPNVGDSICTYAPNYGCYKHGWPECCDEESSNECPKVQPQCEIGLPIVCDSYCSYAPNYQCYELGHPSCCFTSDTTECPTDQPACNMWMKGCEKEDSLPSLYDFACSQRNFEILCYLLQKAELDGLLDKDGTYTLFAPSNRAFKKLKEETITELLKNPTDQLQDILGHHVSNKTYFGEDLSCGGKIDTMIGDFTTTKCDDHGQKFQVGNGNIIWPLIVAKDVVTCNGVAHVVDSIVFPTK